MVLRLRILFLVLICAIGFSQTLNATHNRAGEISYVQTGALTIQATITTYTKASSIPADRDTLTICWGDGFCELVPRSNGNGEILPNDTKVNYYIATHEYVGLGRFTVSMNDPNRNQGICNVNAPNSDNVPFHIETTVTLFNQSLQGFNNSPILLQPPIDIGCVGKIFTHNPNAYDPDGDSLSFHLIVPLQDVGTEVPNYAYPNNLPTSPDNTISLNPVTGEFVWDAPQAECEYNIAFYIISYRDGVAIDTMIRDMQILILTCENDPPEIETIDEICVVAGETVTIDVTATAPLTDSNQLVTLTALGSPFEEENSPATFMEATTFQAQPLTRTFVWNTLCEHIADQYYTVVFRTEDNFPITIDSDTSYLSALKTVRIKVVGPPPEDVQALAGTGQVEVSWQNPYQCENVENYFQGFTVWRRQGSNNFTPDTCETGLAGKGYTEVTSFPIQEIQGGRYYYLDTDVERGRTYCYRILAEFALETTTNPPTLYNKVESLPSEEICVQLSRDIPLITNVSILSTDESSGDIFVQWTKPLADDLDTLLNPGPYKYEVYRSRGFPGGTFEPIGVSFESQTFWQANDTFFTDNGLNTMDDPWSYEVVFFVAGTDSIGTTNPASSPWLSVASTDETNNLSWEADTPWDNYSHIVFIERPTGSSNWDTLATTSEPFYAHTGLVNGFEYCYYVTTIGTYGIAGISDSLINHSQEACGIPLDSIPPCPPSLIVNDECEEALDSTPEEDFINSLIWVNPMNICEATDDVVEYNIYFTPFEGAAFELIGNNPLSTDTTSEHKPEFGIVGCYAVTAIDTFGNESAFSNIVCIDNCPVYNLPNVFTPNGDGANDMYIPFPYRFIDRIEIKIFNRWGQLVFEGTDPDINWNGTNQSGKDLSEGTYFYTCRVFEKRISGVLQEPILLKGYIELLR